MKENSKDLYAEVTARIIADLEKGVRPWQKPWTTGHASDIKLPMRHNGVSYRGVNVLLLWIEAMRRGFNSPMWLTYKQAQLQGGQVRKGERGTTVVYTSPIKITETDEKGDEVERKIQMLKQYTVFNLDQIDGLPAGLSPEPATPPALPERCKAADAFIKETGAVIRYGGGRAYYSRSLDTIQMPPIECFDDTEAFYGTLLHEEIHWSGAKTRLNRVFGQSFGDATYANEELIAELGAAFLCAELGITPEIREDHAAYLSHWLSILKEDTRAIFRAAAQAQRAVDYLKGLQPGQPHAKPDHPDPGADNPHPEDAAAPQPERPEASSEMQAQSPAPC